LPGEPTKCAQERGASTKGSSRSVDNKFPYFETDELRVERINVSAGREYPDPAPKHHALLVALKDANLDASLGGEHLQFVHGGDILWMTAGISRRAVDFLSALQSSAHFFKR
jgi:hypothetical protein